MNDIYSFYQLISKYKIEIPIIQRDYAQGRKDSKAEDVRKSMVADMIAAVKGEKKLFFDFVYGRIDQHKFIPFDGQQRLTTLFLFHKYVFEKCIFCSACEYKSNCICKDVLLRFSYATRQSSREFCERLVKENVIPNNTKLLSENVRNMQWFYSDWEKDPTIMGMLIMLDEIHNQFSKQVIKDYKPLAEKLTNGCNCPITFHFVDMGEHKLSDETYVKMNARGKILTPFENFKASLEQYLENNNEKDYMCRIKENADSKWLDLFWRVVNDGKEEKEKEKILPDDAIMSFINRHFINVWRCWYGVNKEGEKQKEYDSFNQQIIADMPLYPKKDDFVSWDIYQNVLDNCGISKCLTPIFNIWDNLCEQDQDNININEDCQAIWNRGNGKEKWNLYVGIINNDNRETYSSRVAFYALLRYFAVENEETTTTLSQWMRIVWNIIENSTIDSPDTYQAALRLIDKLSEKNHDIHNALANHFEDFGLGTQYHAKEQVAEEIAKAHQICQGELRADEKSREEVIIKAESYAFFKGAIRFLFTDDKGDINWCDFDTKWENAQKFFEESGVKDEEEKYKTEAILLKAVLYNVKDFWKYVEPQKYVFDNKAETWKSNILLEKGWENAVHQILMGKLEIILREGDCLIYKNLYSTNLLNFVANHLQGSRIRWIHDHRALYPPYYDGILLDDENRDNKFYRNHLLSSDSRIYSDQKIEKLNYYKGWDINFKYEGRTFQWNTDERIYLLEDGKRKQNNENENYCVDVTNLNNSQELINKLDYLVAQAYPERFDKACCNDCQDKICE